MQKIDGCHITTAIPIEIMKENITLNKRRSISNVYFMDEWRATKQIALVGGGPSLSNELECLSQFTPIMVCGSAHDYLVDNKIKFEYCIVCDPDPIVINYLQRPQKDVKYLLASQCHSDVFDHLINYETYIWHAACENKDNYIFDNEPIVGGGCTVGTRAIIMAMAFGYYNVHLFGYDTCLSDDYKHHAYDFTDPEKESIGNITEISLGGPSGKKFKVASYMLGQFFDFQAILKEHFNTLKVTVHGEGLLRELMRLSLDNANEVIKNEKH